MSGILGRIRLALLLRGGFRPDGSLHFKSVPNDTERSQKYDPNITDFS